ncbi:DUF4350 domain-containing protein [uncultured Demequina sp.]|uniref:DUF4350 domain-containing protein n=1 Tax=uncultured Demequina sp. TaxID=693499 RepID=UPI0025E3BCFD|nr:DUF4350 domain-containing protein [uncultured Demequina sp.]
MTATAPLHRPPAREGAVRAARRRPLAIVAALLFLLMVAALVWTARPEDYTALSTGNSTPDGTRAVAQILRAQGVDVRQTDSMAGARIEDPARTTLVIADGAALAQYQLDTLADYPGDIALLRPTQATLDALGTGLRVGASLDTGVAAAQCDDVDALAAGSVAVLDQSLSAAQGSTATLCFQNGDGEHAYAVVEDGSRRITVLASWPTITNEHLDAHGHAALGLRMLGRHETVVWYVVDPFDPTSLTWDGATSNGSPPPTEVEARPDFLPPSAGPVAFVLALAVGVAAVWRGRRFGRLVKEPLPVEVRASEATRGRARLYRRAGASGRATAALRARTAMRIGHRLGVPRSADRASLVDAIARAAERDPRDVDAILYGPAPTSDAQMMTIVDQLDTLEREVHRP